MKPQRPLGIVLSAIALGLAALMLLFLSLGGLVTLLAGVNLPSGSGMAAMPSAGVVTAFLLFMLLIYLALAGWAMGTLVGLLRMRPWARISTMVIAGCLVGLGLLSAVSMMGMGALVASGGVPIPPTVTPALFHKVCVGIAIVSLLLAAFGVVWLIYLAQRRTREAFVLAEAQRNTQQPPYATGYPYAAPPAVPGWPMPQVRAGQPSPNPLTDFTVARPLDPPPADPTIAPAAPYDPAQQAWPSPPQPAPVAPWPAPADAAQPARTGRPVSITILSVLALLTAFFSLFGVVSSVPTFLFGRLVSGWPVHVYALVWASAMAIAGLGMLRLQRPAWLLSFVLIGLNSLQYVILLFHGPRTRYIDWFNRIQQQSPFGATAAAAGMASMTVTLVVVFGLAVTVLFAILLWRARWAFTPAAQPPAPDETQTV